MHETVIATTIIEQAKLHGKVKAIHLEIGELAHVPAYELVECLKRLVDWEVHHTEKQAKVDCACGYKGHPTILERGHDFFMIECPQCKGIPKIVEGTEIIIQKVVIA